MNELNLEEIADVVGEFADLSGVRIAESTRLGDDIPIDSRQMLRVAARLESRYGVRFTSEDLITTRTLGDLLNVTRRRAGMA